MRLNPLNGRWVTIVPDRQRRPNDFAPRDRTIEHQTDRPCPFCPGNEEETPPAIETTEADGTWSMRVVPNRYPAFVGDDAFAVHNLGPVHVKAEASGIHEVFVYSPDHFGGLDQLDDAHAAQFMFVLHVGCVSMRPSRSFATRRYRQPRQRGRGIARAPAWPDPRVAVRAGRDPRRGARLRPLRRRVAARDDDRGRTRRRSAGRARRR